MHHKAPTGGMGDPGLLDGGDDLGSSHDKMGHGHDGMGHGGIDHGGMGHDSMGHDSMDHGGMGHDSMDHGGMVHDSMDHGGMDHGGMDHGGMDHDSMDHGGMDHDSMDHGGMGHDSMDHGRMDHGGMVHDSMDHGGMDHGGMDHDSMDHGGMDHDSMDHGGMGHDSMDHGGMDHGGMGHGSMGHDSMGHGGMDHGGMVHGGMDHGGMGHGGMDHGGMGHGGMGHGGMSGMSMAKPVFKWTTEVHVLFQQWTTSVAWELAMAMLVAALLGAAYELMRNWLSAWDNTPRSLRTMPWGKRTAVRTFRSLMHALTAAVGYLQMLLAMTFDLRIFVAVILGSTLGFFVLGPHFRQLTSSRRRKRTEKSCTTVDLGGEDLGEGGREGDKLVLENEKADLGRDDEVENTNLVSGFGAERHTIL